MLPERLRAGPKGGVRHSLTQRLNAAHSTLGAGTPMSCTSSVATSRAPSLGRRARQ